MRSVDKLMMESGEESSRMLTQKVIDGIVSRIMDSVKGEERNTSVTVHGWWNSELKLSRNRVSLAGHRRDLLVSVTRIKNNAAGSSSTNQIDDASLKAVTIAAERYAELGGTLNLGVGLPLKSPQLPEPQTTIWSDETYGLPAEQTTEIAVLLSKESEKNGMLAAGYFEVRSSETATYNSVRPELQTYNKYTQAQCSMTVRHPQGIGSGWAGLSSFDWYKLNAKKLVEISLDKCLRSLNPVAIEPGRYTVIMEPQGFADIMESMFGAFQTRSMAESNGIHPFFLGIDSDLRVGRSKLGLKIVDERINLYHNPVDPQLGVLPKSGMGSVDWIRNGVLQSIGHERGTYSLPFINTNLPDLWRLGYKIDGGSSSIANMIENTQRGLLVTRFWGIRMLDPASILTTGVTRDGLWLIENGKISKAVKNMRYTESIMFSLNQLDSLGESVPVFRPVSDPSRTSGPSPAIVPPIKVNDFSFTSMVDAV